MTKNDNTFYIRHNILLNVNENWHIYKTLRYKKIIIYITAKNNLDKGMKK